MTTQTVVINNAFVTGATREQLIALCVAFTLCGSDKALTKFSARDLQYQRAYVGTKLCNTPATAQAFNDGTLTAELEMPHAEQAPHAEQQANNARHNAQVKSAKAWLRELLSQAGARYTLRELVQLTGKTEVNIRTMLSDLRSAKYCGKHGVFNTKSTRVDGKTYYSAV